MVTYTGRIDDEKMIMCLEIGMMLQSMVVRKRRGSKNGKEYEEEKENRKRTCVSVCIYMVRVNILLQRERGGR